MKKKYIYTSILILLLLALYWCIISRESIRFHPIYRYHSSDTIEHKYNKLGVTYVVENPPFLQKTRIKVLKDFFISLVKKDSLYKYSVCSVVFYKETKYLTRDFKEGGEYQPEIPLWRTISFTNKMDIRNHFDDKIGSIIFDNFPDGRVYFCMRVNPAFNYFSIEEEFEEIELFKSIEDFLEQQD